MNAFNPHRQRPEENVLPYHPQSYFLRQDLSVNPKLAVLIRPTGQQAAKNLPIPPKLGLQAYVVMLGFYESAGDLNSGPFVFSPDTHTH